MIITRVDETAHPETGAPRLRVIIPGKKEPEIYDLSRLLVQPEIACFLAEGFRLWAARPLKAASRANRCRDLNTNVATFLETLESQVSLKLIDETFWASFLNWLNGSRRKDGQPWAQSARARVLGTVAACIDALEGHPVHGAVATYLRDKSGLPRNPWPGRSTKSVPTPVLSPAERRAMILACLGEIRVLRERLEEWEGILETGRVLLDEARSKGQEPPYRLQIGVCAARIAEAFPNRLASRADLSALDPSLNRGLVKYGLLPVRRLLYATFRDLVPFALLIGVKTAFNPDAILSLAWSRVRFSERSETVTFLGVKNRAAGLQASITPDDGYNDLDVPGEPSEPFGLVEHLALLRRLTEHTRAIVANKEHADRLFIGVPMWRGSDAKAFEHFGGPSRDIAWNHALAEFIQAHGLTKFNLQTLRFTEAEEEWRRTGDLLAVRDRLGHKSVSTTRTHYTSAGMRREGQERVAETQTLYHRWVETEGRSDPRNQTERCRSAATPGFGCLNPYDSPRPGQRKGKICTAYGECPGCPLAQAWPQNVQAAAWYLALPKAIYDARLGRVSAGQWAEKWPSILYQLDALLAEIPPHVRAKALRYRVKLKPVG